MKRAAKSILRGWGTILLAAGAALGAWAGAVTSNARYCVIDLSGGPSASTYPVSYLANAPSTGWTDEYKTEKLVLRRIAPGTFKMGGTIETTLSKPFYVGVFEVTQKQYELVTGDNPCSSTEFGKGDAYPVHYVSYNDIRGSVNGSGWPVSAAVDDDSFLGKIQSRTGLDIDLPTEAQWEYACRAGTTTTYSYGDVANPQYMWCATSGAHTVGMKMPNAWGLYDMHGNEWELCLDWNGTLVGGTDPKGAEASSYRVQRGGSWYYNTSISTSSFRLNAVPSDRNNSRGFRLCCPAEPTAEPDELAMLEAAFDGLPATIESDGAGGWKVTLTNDVDGADLPIEIPDNVGSLTLDLGGRDLIGADGEDGGVGETALPGGDGRPAIRIVPDEGDGEPTVLTVTTTGGDALVKGGDGGEGNPPGNGAPAIEVANGVQDGVLINVGEGVTVQGGGVPAIVGAVGENNGTLVKVEVAVPTITGKEYTGETLTADISATALYTVVNDGGVTVGNYPVTLTLVDPENYRWADGDSEPLTLVFAISLAANAWIREPSISDWISGTTPSEPDLGEAAFGTASVTYSNADGDLGTDRPEEAGQYVATFTVEGTDNYSGLTNHVSFAVRKRAENTLKVGEYFKATLAELGYDVPTNGTPYNVVAKGLPAGLSLKYNAAVTKKDKKGKTVVVKKAKVEWWIEGVPTAALDFLTNPPYLVITAEGSTVPEPLSVEVLAQDVVELGDLALGQSLDEQFYLPGVTNGWTVSGLPTGLKYTAKALTEKWKSGNKVMIVTNTLPYTVYGKTTKAGLFTVTAKKKKGSYFETMRFRVLVTPKDVDTARFGEGLTNLTTMAYVPFAWDLTNDVSSVGGKVAKVTGLPAGLTFASANTYAYTNAKKKTGKYLKQAGQTVVGTPTKPGTYVVTFTKNVKSGSKTVAKTAQILWKVVANDAELSLGFNTAGGVIENGTVGLKYGDLLAFGATDGAKVTASGLPAGIKLAELGGGQYAFTGFTTKAGTYLVTVKATLKGKSVTQRVALKVEGLPAWAKGTFNGMVTGGAGTTNGLATVTVSSAGKISGKFQELGTNWTLSAASYTAAAGLPPCQDAFICSNVVAKYAYKVKSGKKTQTRYVERTFELEVCEGMCGEVALGCAAMTELGNADVLSASSFTAWQNLWGRADYKSAGKRLFYTSKAKPYRIFAVTGVSEEGAAIGLIEAETLSIKVTPAGAVAATLSFDTGKTKKDPKTKKTVKVIYKATCATTVVPTAAADADPFTGEVPLFFAPSPANGFTGYAGSASLSQ